MTDRILVTGGNGQLATSLALIGGARVHRVGRPVFDYDHPDSIDSAFQAAEPSIVINAAAHTAVDLAESEPEASARANHHGPRRLAELCAQANVPLIHVSTDYVYDGTKGQPYTEVDATSPTGVYGVTKREGEAAVLAAHAQTIVLRTSWVFSPYGRNFVKTMLNAQLKTNKLRVVADQYGSPTSAPDLATAILAIVDIVESSGFKAEYAGIYHAANKGFTTWHGLATATFEEAQRHGRTMPEVAAISTQDWPTPAKRPPDTRLDCGKLGDIFGVSLPEWRPSLARTVDEVLTAA